MKRPPSGNPGADRPRQLPLALDYGAGYSRDDLFLSRSNRHAVELIESWPSWPAQIVVISGPAGSGKSHLATVWQARSGAQRIVLPSIGDQPPQINRQAALLLDGVDIASTDEVALFHLINATRLTGSWLLMTARLPPAQWNVVLPDLESRLRTAVVIELLPPDDELLSGVIAKLFADRQLTVEPNVIAYIVHRIERSLATAIEIVDRLDRAALAQKRPVTRALAASVIGAPDSGQTELDF